MELGTEIIAEHEELSALRWLTCRWRPIEVGGAARRLNRDSLCETNSCQEPKDNKNGQKKNVPEGALSETWAKSNVLEFGGERQDAEPNRKGSGGSGDGHEKPKSNSQALSSFGLHHEIVLKGA